MINYECPYCGNIMTTLCDVCPDCGAQNKEFRQIQVADPYPQGQNHPQYIQNGMGEQPGSQSRTYIHNTPLAKEDTCAILSMTFAIAGGVFSCTGLGWLVAIAAFVLGIKGLKSQGRKIFAVIGIVCSIPSFLFGAFVFMAAIVGIIG